MNSRHIGTSWEKREVLHASPTGDHPGRKAGSAPAKVDTYGFQRYNLLNTQGRSLIDGSNYSDRAYFKAAMQGNTYVSEPLISSVTGEMTIIISAPVWQDGQVGAG